ncbi:hypothetical protein SAMN05421770_101208 [Granulicella rosea]|uniref:Uncharacterized protein n=1 Tax=Granulicella rosea TaxID=474952 RepID=A0A239D0Y3_9BACT|nr:hypothetical protein [Granulicella rosea]SNS25531.1 hypothetical protein SAMN05421770_101208 [Granulicella rosea]
MKRGGLILLILLLIALGVGFLTMMWIGMRNGIHHQPPRQSSAPMFGSGGSVSTRTAYRIPTS